VSLSRISFLSTGCGFAMAACSPSFVSRGVIPSKASSGKGLMPDELMFRMGIVAVIENGATTVRSDLRYDRELRSHLTSIKRNVAHAPLKRVQETVVDFNTGGDAGGSSGSDDSCTTVGAQCDGLTVIGVTQANSGDSSLLNSSSSSYDTFQSLASIDGADYSGATYTFNKFTTCLGSAAATLATNLTNLAEDIISGAVGAYLTTAQLSTLTGSANAFITGSISAAAFWDVLAAVVGSVTLANLLLAIGGAITLNIAFETVKCEFSAGA
jgi:hypothetical protein